jgi:hypothetical protein
VRRSSCICGHPKVTHRTYARFHACTKRVVGRQCRCQSYRLMPDALREALTDLHDHVAHCERDWALQDRIDRATER